MGPHQTFKYLKMVFKRGLTLFSHKIFSIRLSPNKRLLYTDEFLFFKSLQVACKISVSNVEIFLQRRIRLSNALCNPFTENFTSRIYNVHICHILCALPRNPMPKKAIRSLYNNS
jgi:hypothetical protein